MAVVVATMARMAALDPAVEEMFLGIAHALFVNRLHVLRLTEVVRPWHQARSPRPEHGSAG